jgi:hypothetical protein
MGNPPHCLPRHCSRIYPSLRASRHNLITSDLLRTLDRAPALGRSKRLRTAGSSSALVKLTPGWLRALPRKALQTRLASGDLQQRPDPGLTNS